MPLCLVDQRSQAWFELRDFRITASIAAACLGLDPWNGWLAAFNIITRRTVRDDNAYMKWGRDKEATARAAYEVETGSLVLVTGFYTHPVHDWLGASPDGLIGEDGLLEAKCPSTHLPEEIPVHHEIQMRVQMACTERQWCDYYAWMPAPAIPFLRRVNRDIQKEVDLIEKLEAFYETYIRPDIAPPRRRPT